MKIFFLFFSFFFFSSPANATQVVLYEDDFNFYNMSGDLLLESDLRFDAGTSTASTYGITLGNNYNNYRLEFDLITTGLVGSSHTFGLNFDTPSVQNLDFHGALGIHTFNTNPGSSSLSGNHGAFLDGVLMHVVIDVDLTTNIWSMSENGVLRYSTSFYAANDDVESIRMGLGPWLGGASADPGVYAILDNVVVSTTVVPVPPSIWLFFSGLLVMVAKARRKV